MRRLYLAAGLLFVAFGAIGAVLPLIPTVPFLLLAAFFFARSNPVWEQRILDHRTFGPQVRDWRERRAIPRRVKLTAIASLAAGALFTFATLGFPYVWISLGVLVVIGGWIWTRAE